MSDLPASETQPPPQQPVRISNPYEPGSPQMPFAGRAEAFTRLHQHLIDSQAATLPPLYLGRRRIGKTALLQQVERMFDPEETVAVYIPLRRVPLSDETRWLETLAQAIRHTIEERAYHAYLLPPLPGEGEMPEGGLRNWIHNDLLPAVFYAIRSQRRLVLLLDDADRLAQALESGALPADHPGFLAGLLGRQLGMALTMDTLYEDHLSTLSPLVEVASTLRIGSLSPAASVDVLAQCNLSEGALAAALGAAGGEPILLQRFGYHLFELGRTKTEPLTANDVKGVLPYVYTDSEGEFRETWATLPRDERLVLTAISSLLYDNPLRAIDIALIETWLVETDYPLDATTIIAAVRGLMYREIVTGAISTLKIPSGLMQRWLLENAQLTPPAAALTDLQERPRDWRGWVVVGVVVLVVIAAVMAISLSGGGSAGTTIVPTVTLP
ncbi:MAG: ATP-binding protein [bacterium]|nr:ATP-binding protein [bacterium]